MRAPPVSSRNRSCRLSRISASDNARTRAAASSIASGMPSRRRQISPTAAALSSVDGEVGPGPAGAVGEQLDRLVGQRQRRHPPAHLAGHPDRLTAGRQHRQPRRAHPAARRPAPRSRRADARSCPAPPACCRSPKNRSSVSIVERPGWSGRPSARATVDRHHAGIGDRRQIDVPHPVAELGRDARRDLDGQSGLARSAGTGQRHQPVVGQQLLAPRSSVRRGRRNWSAAPEDCGRQRLSDARSGGNSLRRSGWHSCTTRSGRGRSRSGWVPRSVSHASGREPVDDQCPRSRPTARSGRRAPDRAAARCG